MLVWPQFSLTHMTCLAAACVVRLNGLYEKTQEVVSVHTVVAHCAFNGSVSLRVLTCLTRSNTDEVR